MPCVQGWHCVKTVLIRNYYDPYFTAFRLNKCGNIRTKITSNMDTFHAVRVTSFTLQISTDSKLINNKYKWIDMLNMSTVSVLLLAHFAR